MSVHQAIERVCGQAQDIAVELRDERRRRLSLESENADLRHRLRSAEIALHSNAPMDALGIVAEKPKRRLNS